MLIQELRKGAELERKFSEYSFEKYRDLLVWVVALALVTSGNWLLLSLLAGLSFAASVLVALGVVFLFGFLLYANRNRSAAGMVVRDWFRRRHARIEQR